MGIGSSNRGESLGDIENIRLTPRKQYRETAKQAIAALPELDPDPRDLYKILFRKEELEWHRTQLKNRHNSKR